MKSEHGDSQVEKFDPKQFTETAYIAKHNTILRATVGSTVYGLNIPGQDDTDEMGICIEPPDFVLGLRQFEQWVYRTQPEGHRSGPGDLDLTIYGLRKYVRLAAKGNPSILLLLYVPNEYCSIRTQLGQELRDNADKFASKIAIRKYLGYMKSQKERLLGDRGQMRVNRPELIEAHGFDTKYAMHALRLGFQGREFARTGRVSLPMNEADRSFLYAVRSGEVPLERVKVIYEKLENDLETELGRTKLPDEPDWHGINSWLMAAFLRHWQYNQRIRQSLKDWRSE